MPQGHPKFPAIGQSAVLKSIPNIIPGEFKSQMLKQAPNKAPIITGNIFLGCLPKEPNPATVKIPDRVAPFKSPLINNTNIVASNPKIPILRSVIEGRKIE